MNLCRSYFILIKYILEVARSAHEFTWTHFLQLSSSGIQYKISPVNMVNSMYFRLLFWSQIANTWYKNHYNDIVKVNVCMEACVRYNICSPSHKLDMQFCAAKLVHEQCFKYQILAVYQSTKLYTNIGWYITI